MNLTPKANVSVSIGKLDTPLGFERDDEPLNLQATSSYNFELARPAKLVGALGCWAFARRFDITGWVANGWDGDLELNRGKTVGGRLGIRPTERASSGIGFLYGPEGAGTETRTRYLTTLDYAMQPDDHGIAGEVNYGGDQASDRNAAASWYGGTATIFRQVTRSFGIAGRADGFPIMMRCSHGSSADVELAHRFAGCTSLALAAKGFSRRSSTRPFASRRFQIRADLRWDHSALRVTPDDDEADELVGGAAGQ